MALFQHTAWSDAADVGRGAISAAAAAAAAAVLVFVPVDRGCC